MIWLLTVMLSAGPGGHASDVPRTAAVAAPRCESADVLLAATSRRVRSANKRITKLLEAGVRRSRTFAQLVEQIHRTNVIVYVEPSFGLPPDVAGRILLQTVAGNQRYLRVQVRATLQGDHAIAVIAHELRHALEVADDPAVVDDEGLLALYRRIGHSSAGNNGFDTDAARIVGRIVRDELVG